MLRRKKKADGHSSNGSFSYSRVESVMKSQGENEVITNSIDVDTDVKLGASWNANDKKIFEDQLESLQDQLIATMMENQKLGWSIFIDSSQISVLVSGLQRSKCS